jgi:hypothetical protein
MRGSLAAWLLLALAGAAPAAVAAEIAVGQRYGETVASTELDGCRVALEHNPRWHALRYRNGCAAPFERKVALFAELLAALFADGGLPAEVASLGLGRLVDYPELSARLALAVRGSGEWDAGKARFRSQGSGGIGALNHPFAAMIDREALFRPFVEALTPYGIASASSSVEKVLVGPPRLTPVAETLLDAGVGAEERLPFDAQVWLVLKHAAASNRQ